MFVIFCAWPSFITIKYNCTLTKLTPYRVYILFAKLLKCYIFFQSNLVHESATIQDLFRCFFHFTLGGYQMVVQSNFIIQCLNKDIGIAVISYSKSFSTSSSLCASAVSLLKSEVGFRLIYFPSFMTTVLYRLAIGWIIDLDLIFVVCRKSSWIAYPIPSMLSQLIKRLFSVTVVPKECDLNLSSVASKGECVDTQSYSPAPNNLGVGVLIKGGGGQQIT